MRHKSARLHDYQFALTERVADVVTPYWVSLRPQFSPMAIRLVTGAG